MRGTGWIIAALIAGFLLGGLQPRRELADTEDQLRGAQRQLEALRRKLDRTRRPRSFLIPGVDALYDPGDPPAPPERSPSEGAPAEPEAADSGANEPDGGARIDPPALPPETFSAAVEAQRLRAAQSRAALIERLDLSDGEIAAFDTVVEDMNDQLSELADDLAAIALADEQPRPGDLLAVTHDLTGVLLDAQEGLEDIAGEDIETLDESTGAVWNYIDLGIFEGTALGDGAGR